MHHFNETEAQWTYRGPWAFYFIRTSNRFFWSKKCYKLHENENKHKISNFQILSHPHPPCISIHVIVGTLFSGILRCSMKKCYNLLHHEYILL